MARPKKERELSHSHHITIRLTETQYEAVTHAAQESGLSRSDYIRQQILNGKVINTYDFRVELPELQRLTSEFHNIGNNLNQIAKHFNTGGVHSQEMRCRINRCVSELFDLRKEVLKMAGDFHGNTKTYRKQKC